MNPGRPLKPIGEISDRGKRYRAQKNAPADPKQCVFCGSRRNVEIDHVNGKEADAAPNNLMWLCRACNTRKGLLFKRKGLGVRTVQFNPPRSRSGQMEAYAAAIKVMRGAFEGDVSKAVATIRATPASVRSAYTARTWRTRRAIYGPSGRQSDLPF